MPCEDVGTTGRRATEWLDRPIVVAGNRIQILVKQMPLDDRIRLSAELRWLADGFAQGSDGLQETETAWNARLQSLVAHYIEVRIPPEALDALSLHLDRVLRGAIREFTLVNAAEAECASSHTPQ